MEMPATVRSWHAIVDSRDPAGLDEILADDVVFRSPAVHTPQEGKPVTTAYLTAAMRVLGPTLTYHGEWYAESSAVLEFTADLGGRTVHGVDMMSWGEDGRITQFTVMARPMSGLQALMPLMVTELEQLLS